MTINITSTFRSAKIAGRSADWTPATGSLFIWDGCTLIIELTLPSDTPDHMIWDMIHALPITTQRARGRAIMTTLEDRRALAKVHMIAADAFARSAEIEYHERLARIDAMLVKIEPPADYDDMVINYAESGPISLI